MMDDVEALSDEAKDWPGQGTSRDGRRSTWRLEQDVDERKFAGKGGPFNRLAAPQWSFHIRDDELNC